MLILLMGLYSVAATCLALALLRGGSCLNADAAAAREGDCCTLCAEDRRRAGQLAPGLRA